MRHWISPPFLRRFDDRHPSALDSVKTYDNLVPKPRAGKQMVSGAYQRRHVSVVFRCRQKTYEFRQSRVLHSQSGVQNLGCRGQAGPANRFLVQVRLDIVFRRTLEEIQRIFDADPFLTVSLPP
jgi:hypothetical protein